MGKLDWFIVIPVLIIFTGIIFSFYDLVFSFFSPDYSFLIALVIDGMMIAFYFVGIYSIFGGTGEWAIPSFWMNFFFEFFGWFIFAVFGIHISYILVREFVFVLPSFFSSIIWTFYLSKIYKRERH